MNDYFLIRLKNLKSVTKFIIISFPLDHIIWQSLATADFCGSLAGVIYLATLIKPHMERESIMNPLTLEEGRYNMMRSTKLLYF